MARHWCVLTIFLSLLLGARSSVAQGERRVDPVLVPLKEHVLRSHIRFLADDLLEGRGPGSRGDALTRLYIRCELESLGLGPGGAEGSWNQRVPLVGVTTFAPEKIQFRAGEKTLELTHLDDMMLNMGAPVERAAVQDAELVFVGYGIQAPEYQWDDFKQYDVKGKVLVFMNNDPASSPDLFAGRRRLYYGRWDYKYAIAAKLGAAGALIIHTTPSAGYPYQVVQTSWSGEQFELADEPGPRTVFNGWITEEAARRLCALSGHDLDALRRTAESREFHPVPLGITTSIELRARVRRQETGNVLGVLPGSDPQLKHEYVVFTAHHDHLGVAPQRDATGDNIYNGAIDNASGVALVLTIARELSEMRPRPRRSILFALVGAEEQGLLGSKYLAEHSPVHPGAISAVINIDGVNFLGPTRDVNLISMGKSDLDQLVEQVARAQGRVVVPDLNPDRGYYYRSDQFSFAQVGVPGVYLHSGINVIGKPDGWGKERLDRWVREVYHQPSDEYDDTWDLSGALLDGQLLLAVGLMAANREEMAKWNPGDEFEATRKRMLQQRAGAETTSSSADESPNGSQ